MHLPTGSEITISPEPITIIAEISANHLGSYSRAKALVDVAKTAGATHIKFQHFTPETLTVKGHHPDLLVRKGSLWENRSLWDLYQEAMMPWEWTADLVAHCNEIGIQWLSTPFDESAVDFLEQFEPSIYKIASFEIIDLPLIRYVASTGKGLIISTGMATEAEIGAALDAALGNGAKDVALLRTNSGYPASPEEMDLATIPYMREKWNVPVGLSDHTLGNTSAIVAASLGASIFEKHITLRRSDGGPDAEFSTEPEEFETYVGSLRLASSTLGDIRFGPSEREKPNLGFRPSLRAVTDIAVGEIITSQNVKSVRPAGGLPPENFSEILGSRTTRALRAGDPLTLADLGLSNPERHAID